MTAITIIGCVVGVVSCVVGVSTFVSAQITKAKQDGMLIAKIDQCVNGIESIKSDMKEKNREFDTVIDEHTRKNLRLDTQVRNIYEHLNLHS